MQRIAVVTVLLMVFATVPAASGNHTSVGSDDVLLAESEEGPEDPTVTEDDYEAGTSRDCRGVDTGTQDPHEFEQAMQVDDFCGLLIYHQNSDYETISDEDQVYPGGGANPIGEFDVIRTYTPMLPIGMCAPWCEYYPASDTLFEAFHDAGSLVGLTEEGEEADRKEGSRSVQYGLNSPAYPMAFDVIQQETGAWRMNGPSSHYAVFEHFVGFLSDDAGDPVNETRLQNIYDSHENQFSADSPTQPSVCGFSSDGAPTGGIGAGQDSFCEVEFYYAEPRGDQTSFQDGYRDRCKSPTYVCGAIQPAWHSTASCWATTNPCTKYGSALREFDYTRWHWVVAPTQSGCQGRQAPGFVMQNAIESADLAYLAHDLDVWTDNLADLRDVDNTSGMDSAHTWMEAQPGHYEEDVSDAVEETYAKIHENASSLYGPPVDNATSLVNNLTDDVPGVPSLPQAPSLPESLAVPDRTKSSEVEPNAHTNRFDGLSESSQSYAVPRNGLSDDGGEEEIDPCDAFFGGAGGEDGEQFFDPWVNYIDMDKMWKHVGVGGACDTDSSACGGVYGNNEADHQDDTNAPTQGFVYFQGKVGVATDKQDNGWYDQPGRQNMFDVVAEVGFYPMLWDMRLDASGEPDIEAGCTIGSSTTPLPELMVDSHYGPHTGLVMAVYLQEPSALYDGDDVVAFPSGETIFILESQAMHVLRNENDDRVLAFEQRLIDGLQTHPDIAENADVVYATDVYDDQSAFGNQCEQASGGFDTEYSLLHQCETGCEGDTIVTAFMGESTTEDFLVGNTGGEGVPPLEIGKELWTFREPIETWLDVDPFDNDPDRNREESSAPPH